MKRTATSAARLVATAVLLALAIGACEGRRTLTLFPESPSGGDAGRDARNVDPPFVHCEEDRDCPDEFPSCDDDHDRCVECGPAVPCRNGLVCYLEDRVCEPPCNGADDCGGERAFCNFTSGLCVECLQHEDCPEWASRCEERTGRCGDCATDGDCGTMHCRPQDLECVECLGDSDCEANEECRRGECRR